MPLVDLTNAEKSIIHECLKCVAYGGVIAHDWEFQTLFGIEVAQLRSVVDAWPNVDDSDQIVSLAINNSINSLLGLIDDATLNRHLPYPRTQVLAVFQKWRGMPIDSYFSGLR